MSFMMISTSNLSHKLLTDLQRNFNIDQIMMITKDALRSIHIYGATNIVLQKRYLAFLSEDCGFEKKREYRYYYLKRRIIRICQIQT